MHPSSPEVKVVSVPTINESEVLDSEFCKLLSKIGDSQSEKVISLKKAWMNDSNYRKLILSTMEEIIRLESMQMDGRGEGIAKEARTLHEIGFTTERQSCKTLQTDFRFPLINLIGRGGTGDVWHSLAPGGIPVAIKMVPLVQSLAFKEKRSLELFCKIRHPNIISVLGYWVEKGILWIEMELAECNLLQWYERATANGKSPPFAKMLDYFEQAAKAIDFLNLRRHPMPDGSYKNLQHGDIKLTNMLLVGESLKIADFGLGRSLLSEGDNQHSGSYTAIYAPPCFFDGKTHTNSDQYSLAICYARLRMGKFPFQGSMLNIMHGHCFEEPDLGDLQGTEKQVLARALAKSPADRWSSACQFMAELKKAVQIKESNIPWSSGVGQSCSCD